MANEVRGGAAEPAEVTCTPGADDDQAGSVASGSAVDYNGTFEMNGGTLIGTNIDGMVSEGIDAGSQASMYVTTTTPISGGTVIHIESADGESVLTYETVNDLSVIVFSSPDLVPGETYDIYIDGGHRRQRQWALRQRCLRPGKSPWDGHGHLGQHSPQRSGPGVAWRRLGCLLIWLVKPR